MGINENNSQIYQVLPLIRKLIKHRQNFVKYVNNIKNIEKELENNSLKIEKIFDFVSETMTPSQLAQFMLKIDLAR